MKNKQLLTQMQKITVKLATITLSLSMPFLTGCNQNITHKQVNTTTGKVLEVQYRPSYQIPYWNPTTKAWGYRHQPEDYSTFIKCNNAIYNLDSKEAYDLCKDRVQEEIYVDYIMIYYEDGTIDTHVEVGGYR